jgi:hypothetical protein
MAFKYNLGNILRSIKWSYYVFTGIGKLIIVQLQLTKEPFSKLLIITTDKFC